MLSVYNCWNQVVSAEFFQRRRRAGPPFFRFKNNVFHLYCSFRLGSFFIISEITQFLPLSLQFPAAFNRLGQSDYVCILQVSSDGNSMGYSGDFDACIFEKPGKVHCSSLSLYCRVGRQYDFCYLVRILLEPYYELLYADFLGAPAFHGRYGSVQNMVESLVLTGPLHCRNIFWRLNYTYGASVPFAVGAYVAWISLSYVGTYRAEDYFLFCVDHGFRQSVYIL